MKSLPCLMAISLAALSFSFSALAQQSASFSGHWQGSLKTPSGDLNVAVDLTKDAKGAWIGSFSMPEIGATDIPLDQLSVTQGKVHFVLNGVPGSPAYDGSLSADGRQMEGTFAASQNKSPLLFTRNGAPKVKAAVPNSPLPKEFEGSWHAILQPGDSQIRMVLKLSRAADGTASGVIINVDQANREVPISSIQIKDKTLDFDIRAVSVHYHGTIGTPPNAIGGTWGQMQRTAPLTFERGPFPPNSTLSKSFEGTWKVTMDGGETNKIVLALKLAKAADGTATGSLRNVSEAGKEMTVTDIKLSGKTVAFTVQGLGATFTGTLNAAGTEFAGNWIMAGTAMPVTFKRGS